MSVIDFKWELMEALNEQDGVARDIVNEQLTAKLKGQKVRFRIRIQDPNTQKGFKFLEKIGVVHSILVEAQGYGIIVALESGRVYNPDPTKGIEILTNGE